MTFITICALVFTIVMLVSMLRQGPPSLRTPLYECPYCLAMTPRTETVDYESDVLQYHCDRCKGFMGARELGTAPGHKTELMVKGPRGR